MTLSVRKRCSATETEMATSAKAAAAAAIEMRTVVVMSVVTRPFSGGSASRHTWPVESRQAQVSLLRWIRRQLAQREGIRERIEAAVAHDDPAELRRLVEALEFSEAQRQNILVLVAHWEQARAAEEGQGGGGLVSS